MSNTEVVFLIFLYLSQQRDKVRGRATRFHSSQSEDDLGVAESLDDLLVLLDPLGDLGVGLGLGGDLGDGLRPLEVNVGLDLALGLQGGDHVLVLPSDLVAQTTKGAELEK